MRLDPARNPWMAEPQTRAVIAALTPDKARFVGGVVRNALLGLPVADIDIATPLEPDEVIARLKTAGVRSIPTGIDHGTITAVVDGKHFEITTLRRDIATDGRHAVVAFSENWAEDAKRRDFTMNALYASADGEVFDYVGGIEDLNAGRVRFVGDAAARIREDYLRILRLFRFQAWYGRGEIDGEALRAAAAQMGGLEKNVSGERIRSEMLKLLLASNPIHALRTMNAVGILSKVLMSNLSFDRLDHLARIDTNNFLEPDSILRLAALLPNDMEEAKYVSEEWSLSNAQKNRLEDLATAQERIVSYLAVRDVRRLLYRLGPARFKDRVFLRWAEDPKESNAVQWRALLAMADAWRRPRFPLSGANVMAAGVPEGPLVGRILAEVEEWWIESDFTDDQFSIAERLKAVVQALA